MSVLRLLIACALGCALAVQSAAARDQLRVVGSSTVFPFVAAVAERFGSKTDFATPIVEATGTGGGLKEFCQGAGEGYPDMASASRRIKASEVALCEQNDVNVISELPIGFDGIVLANASEGPEFQLSKTHLFLALAREVPQDGEWVDNPYTNWQQIDAQLPDLEIAVYGPPPTSGTRDAFVEMVMEEACHGFDIVRERSGDADALKARCTMMREDGKYIEAKENDNLIVQKLTGNADALGIFGFSFLDQNASLVKANPVGGVMPTFEAIANGQYGIARSMYVYVKNQHEGLIPGLKAFAKELTSDAAIGQDGYLTFKGLIPLPEKRHQATKDVAAKLTPMAQEETN